MSLMINHNLIAMGASRSLNRHYSYLAVSTERLSSGLRINSAKDDPAGLAIRELMRSDIAIMHQGARNTADGISLIQTAEGAMQVIDEKLIRMKELAEQAATGTYTTVQREIINSEYQAMAAEIDRIAAATEFNGIKLLDGSITQFHVGTGLKIHFGSLNNSAEDYYMVNIGDVRATTKTGLRVGGDGYTDVHRQAQSAIGTYRLDDVLFTNQSAAGHFLYYYNFVGDDLLTSAEIQSPSFMAGIYEPQSGSSLQHLINQVNQGTASRVQLNFGPVETSASGTVADLNIVSSGVLNLCIGNEVYQLGSGAANERLHDGVDPVYIDIAGLGGTATGALVASAIASSSENYWAVFNSANNTVMIFSRLGGDNDELIACDEGDPPIGGGYDMVTWTNVETGKVGQTMANFSLGGETWAQAGWVQEDGRYFLSLTGANIGDPFDLYVGDASAYGLTATSGFTTAYFEESQNASWGDWAGAQLRTQSHAQEALETIKRALVEKDIIRANLGALQNRLENTMTNISVQIETQQGAESRISDVDVATEMTNYTRSQIMAQAATSMLAQANTLPELALSLLG